MNINLLVPRTIYIIVIVVLNHLDISWSSRDIKTYFMEYDHFSMRCVRIFYICIYTCIVKIVLSSLVLVGNPVAKMV